MGGGTTIVEALALGRKAIGNDLNVLAGFVADVKTSPLSDNDQGLIVEWVGDLQKQCRRRIGDLSEPIRNLPRPVQQLLADLTTQIDWLPADRQRRFLRCALLRTAQWAIDRDRPIARRGEIIRRFSANVLEMLDGMRAFVRACADSGVARRHIRSHRVVLSRSAIGIEEERVFQQVQKPSLVVTSPPYPGVHILYHRWQVGGRRETSTPYWLAALKDGHTASHYTFGSRSRLGLENYFRNLELSFASVRRVVAPDALVVQLVAFSEARCQLPLYLAAMERAGFKEVQGLIVLKDNRVWRKVPNRRWYCHFGNGHDSASEVVLCHRPA
jgi:hypothetical protein